MEIGKLERKLHALKNHWNLQGILGYPNTVEDIIKFSFGTNLVLPMDFVKYFSLLNGMESLFPNNFDNEGFLFYPFHGLRTISKEFHDVKENNTLLFADYMHKSWWYGLTKSSDSEYSIGILSEKNKFKVISTSLEDFIEKYIQNSPILYNYD